MPAARRRSSVSSLPTIHWPTTAAREYQRLMGGRVTIVATPQASHAAIAEQPEFISATLIDYARGLGEPFDTPAGAPSGGIRSQAGR
jgi:hypothetical protein